jgi:hypothetical protein
MSLTQVDGGLLSPTNGQFYGFKSRIINGAMVIDQRNAGASVSTSSGVSTYAVDRCKVWYTQTSKFTIQQNAGSVTPPTGFINYVGATSSSAYSVGSTDRFMVGQAIEGLNVADLGWGAAGASTVTISFWVRSSLTGTFGGALGNYNGDRSYVFTYTISSANTWEYKTVTVTGDTTGTWLKDNSGGLFLYLSLGAGSSVSTTAGSWQAGFYVSATGATSVVGTNGATFYITGVQLEKGSTATSFDYRPYGTELALCYRYFIKTNPTGANGSGGLMGSYYTTTTASLTYSFPVTMRAAPTVTRTSAGGNGDTFWVSNISASSSGTSQNVNTTTTGMWQELNSMSGAAVGYPAAYNGSLQLSAEL